MTSTGRRARLVLADGRTLSYGTYGDPEGSPLLLLDGPGSRVVAEFAGPVAGDVGVHLVAPDRPGAGESDPKPDRTVLDWADDARQLAEHLGWERFAVLGVAGGSPFAIATAHALGDRVTWLGLVSALAPLDLPGVTEGMSRANRRGYWLARRAPWVLRRSFRRLRVQAQRHPERVAEQLMATRPEDAPVMQSYTHRHLIIDAMPGLWKSAESNAEEFVLMARPWGVAPEEVRVPTLLWYGSADSLHPPAMGQALADRIPDARLTVVPDVGAFAFITHIEPILRALCQPVPAGQQRHNDTPGGDEREAEGGTLPVGEP